MYLNKKWTFDFLKNNIDNEALITKILKLHLFLMETNNITLKFPQENELNLYFCEDVEQSATATFNKDFIKLVTEYSALIKDNNKKLQECSLINKLNKDAYNPITIHLSTYGGSCYDGLSMYSTINNVADSDKYPFNVEIRASGMIASMGIILLLSVPFEKRIAYKDTIFLIHQISAISLGALKDIEESVDELKRLNKQLFDIIVSRTDITQEQLDEIYIAKKDWVMTAEEALKLKLISAII